MFGQDLILRTKLMPPRIRRRVLSRARLTERLQEALERRLTIIQAGTGYGKSTALITTLTHLPQPTYWYTITESDAEPLLFLLHLIYAFRTRAAADSHLGERSLALLQTERGGNGPGYALVIDALVNDLAVELTTDAFLVLDDYHLVNAAPAIITLTDRLIEVAPPNLHVIVSTRQRPNLPGLVRWQVRDEVLALDRHDLAFRPAEIGALFQLYGYGLSAVQIETLAAETEGWAIALQLVGQGVRAAGGVAQVLTGLPDSLERLFDYLAQEILDKETPARRAFLLQTSILRHLTPAACDVLTGCTDSQMVLQTLEDQGLFVIAVGDEYRYHPLFGEFLSRQLAPAEAPDLHRRAAIFYQDRSDNEAAIHHLLLAHEFDAAAQVMAQIGEDMLRLGRREPLSTWIQRLPVDTLAQTPALLRFQGDICRQSSRFDEALAWYEQAYQQYMVHQDRAGMSRALRGQALVHLDTVRPAQAESLLQEALRLIDGQDDRENRARLLELLAENQLNLGHPEESERLRARARELRQEGPGEAELAVRVLLRTGQLDQARRLLEEQAAIEQREPVQRPRSHRETLLILSLIQSFQGEGEAAYRYATEGIARGQALNSPFVIAVGYMRQGHAWLLRDAPSYEAACRCYQEAIVLGDTLTGSRLKVEALWGLCRAHGFQGELAAAEQAAQQGIQVAEQAGDEWIAALIRVVMGGGYVLARQYAAAIDWLVQAETAFQNCGDVFGQTVARLWRCLVAWEMADLTGLEPILADLLRATREHGFEYICLRKTLLGPPDPRRLVPLLLFARDTGYQPAFVEQLLGRLGLTHLEIHPGYQLRVQALGPFRVWRGAQEIQAFEWQRDKARQLFQLLLTYRQDLLDREQIVELLWPGLEPESARRDFKVALSTLYRALEPDRRAGDQSAFVARSGSRYGWRPEADVWLDVDQLERLIAEGDGQFEREPQAALEHYRQALALYQGEYLPERRYEEWCAPERDRLLALYLGAADRLAHALIDSQDWEGAIEVCQTILAHDDCWEQAYRLLMTAYARLGNRAQALRAYHRCVECLREELDVAPSAETARLYESV
ncbi:MAG: tetratricopeptide repeat protein, partial [Chloroflexi bacterium]|nr:tetratricopeptide repeat protein [Chloroflexota bacterium]